MLLFFTAHTMPRGISRLKNKTAYSFCGYRERYKKPTWETPIPSKFQLSDDRILKFVECLKPVVLLSMFNKMGSFEAATCLQQLAQLKPDAVLPTLLDRLVDHLKMVLCRWSIFGEHTSIIVMCMCMFFQIPLFYEVCNERPFLFGPRDFLKFYQDVRRFGFFDWTSSAYSFVDVYHRRSPTIAIKFTRIPRRSYSSYTSS